MEQSGENQFRVLLEEKRSFFEPWSDVEKQLNEKLSALKPKPGVSTYSNEGYNFSHIDGLLEQAQEYKLDDIKGVYTLLDETLTQYGNYTIGSRRLLEKHELLRKEWQRLRDFLDGVAYAEKTKEKIS